MVSKAGVLGMLQDHFDRIDAGDAVAAAAVLSPSVDWSYVPSPQFDDFGVSLEDLVQLGNRESVEAFFAVACPDIVSSGLRHTVVDLVVDGHSGGFICEVASSENPDVARSMIWFELSSSGLVDRYVMRPL